MISVIEDVLEGGMNSALCGDAHGRTRSYPCSAWRSALPGAGFGGLRSQLLDDREGPVSPQPIGNGQACDIAELRSSKYPGPHGMDAVLENYAAEPM